MEKTRKNSPKMQEAEITNFEALLERDHGTKDSATRISFEAQARAFMIGELIKEQRQKAKMTQEQLADKIGAKKSFISRIENGKVDIQLSTLYRLLENGLGRNLTMKIS
jgi:HTH-type transcriptional regulator/antitoxin HipB